MENRKLAFIMMIVSFISSAIQQFFMGGASNEDYIITAIFGATFIIVSTIEGHEVIG